MRPSRTLIIAEAGVNHNGSLDAACGLVEAAAQAGADVVKFQTFRADRLVAPGAPKADYQQRTTGADESQLDMVRRLELTPDDHRALLAHCAQNGIAFLSTPFDLESIDLLRGLGIGTGKVPSGEITNKPYLQAMARVFERLIISTGMCTLQDVRDALDVVLQAGASRERITLLHCNTEYPTPMADVNLRAMRTLADEFGTEVGYSDHTEGIEVPIAAVALGARVIEKHITLDRTMPGPDHRASIEPDELKAMVRAIRNIELALGSARKEPSPSEQRNMDIARRSIHLARAVPSGRQLTADDLVMLRPGSGISPMRLDDVLGRTVRHDLPAGHLLRPTDMA
ncbi:MAG TPA: N-acetylneuraminate synthase [Flavobacteriales bacterium]|nr:N-acetylneuraminate synthase [Flavobacteriales bacterium]